MRALSIRSNGDTTVLSTGGFSTAGTVTFSSNVVITGDVEVRAAKAKAIWIPNGGIHLSDVAPGANTPPGQVTAKTIKVSTITLSGSAILFENPDTLQIEGTWTRTGGIDTGNQKVKGKIILKNSGAGSPLAADCNAAALGTFFERTDSPKLYYCRADSTWGVLTMTAAP